MNPKPEVNTKILEVKGLKKYFPIRKGFFKKTVGQVKSVDELNFFIEKGETLGLVGESGCGKSSLGRLMLGLEKPSSGEVIWRLVEKTSCLSILMVCVIPVVICR